MDVVELTLERWTPWLNITLYVDDLTLAAHGAADRTARTLAEATEFAIQKLEQLGMTVSVLKSKVVATLPEIAKKVARVTRQGKLTAAKSAKLLGVGAAGARRRCAWVTTKRLKTFQKMVPRLHPFLIATRLPGVSADRQQVNDEKQTTQRNRTKYARSAWLCTSPPPCQREVGPYLLARGR